MAVDPADAKRIHDVDQGVAAAANLARAGMSFFFGVIDQFRERPSGPPMETRYAIATTLTQTYLASLFAGASAQQRRGPDAN